MKIFYITLLMFILTSCNVIRNSPKTAFNDGFYSQKINKQKEIVYVDLENDELHIHSTIKINSNRIIDTLGSCSYFPLETNLEVKTNSFKKNTLDLDFLTIPLKYRPKQLNVPSQLNATLNGAVYIGYRTDLYKVSYSKTPLNSNIRNINHYGFSFGFLSGLGNTAMNPTTTFDNISTEYDGIIWTKGIAGIFAINNLTAGLTLGFDNLLDHNRKFWIYESKPWLGLTFGLNLN